MSVTSPAGSTLLGALRPRVEVHPPYAYTLVDVADDLAKLAGLTLDPWQRDGLELLCACRADDMWACPEYVEMVGRQNGKGGIAEARALPGLLVFGEELILWTAHEVKTAMRAFRRLKRLFRRLGQQVGDNENLILIEDERISPDPIWIKFCNQNGDEGFERLEDGQVVQELRFIARSKGSGRGFSADLLFIDETFAYTDEQHEAVFSTMSARRNPQIVYTSTPPLSGTTGAVLYGLRERALAGGDPDLAYRDWGLEGELEQLDELLKELGVDLGDPSLAARTNPAYGGRLSPAFVAREHRTLSRIGYARERLGIWPKQVGRSGELIDLQRWGRWLDVDSAASGPVCFALDSSPERSMSAIGMTGRRSDGLRHWQVLEHRPGMGWVAEKAKELDEIPNVGWCVDPTSPAGALIPDLEKAGLTVHKISGQELQQACTAMLNAAVDGSGRHIGQAALEQAWRDARTVTSGESERFGRKKSSGDITPLMVVTLSDHGFRVHGESEVAPWVVYA